MVERGGNGWLNWTLITLGALVVVGVALELPEIRRYLRIRSM